LSLAPVVIHVEAMGLVLQFNSKMASNGCTAAYATNFSRTATFEIPRGDLVTLHTCVRHLVFLNILFDSSSLRAFLQLLQLQLALTYKVTDAVDAMVDRCRSDGILVCA
jgi:hypothetical protein